MTIAAAVFITRLLLPTAAVAPRAARSDCELITGQPSMNCSSSLPTKCYMRTACVPGIPRDSAMQVHAAGTSPQQQHCKPSDMDMLQQSNKSTTCLRSLPLQRHIVRCCDRFARSCRATGGHITTVQVPSCPLHGFLHCNKAQATHLGTQIASKCGDMPTFCSWRSTAING